jgi:hypothetical protein
MTEEQLAREANKVQELALRQMITPADDAFMAQIMGATTDLGIVLQALVNGEISEGRFAHVAESLHHMVQLAVNTPDDKKTP